MLHDILNIRFLKTIKIFKFTCKLQIKKLSIHSKCKQKTGQKKTLNWKRIIDLLVPDQQHKVLKTVTIRDNIIF